ncbi:flap endonuclease-1 [Candidatus Pacearchaeota archaeon]|nr:flap endonuclease-1 [Candidatus Pacearchaeota archaeon]
MGLNIAEIVPKKEISFDDLKGKTVAVDAFNTIYQFLSTIRQPDGTPLMDSKHRVTSHLSGLFYRNISLLNSGLRLVYVFDGKSPKQKSETQEKRQEIKYEAMQKYEKAKQEEDIEKMGKYAKQLTSINEEIIKESKELLDAIGVPYVQAISEGEAQAAYICRKENYFAVASQDYDSLLFHSPRLVQNLTLARKRKTATGYIDIKPQLIELETVLNSLQITHEQLICLGILVGTDYNPKGIKGIGPKKALQLVKQYKEPALIFRHMPAADFDWQEIFYLFKKPELLTNYNIKFKKFDTEKIKQVLCKEHDFSEERVESALEKLDKIKEAASQKDLKKWF